VRFSAFCTNPVSAFAWAAALAAFWLWPAPAAPEAARAEFSGTVKRGETFAHPLPGGLVFRLVPESQNLGWQIAVTDPARPGENLARFTPPFHFVPNPRFIEGWHFRNADNSGPNAVGEKNVNAPQEIRDFIFSPEVGRSITWPIDREDVKRITRDGQGMLTITHLDLGNLVPGERAWIESMRFTVRIRMGGEISPE